MRSVSGGAGKRMSSSRRSRFSTMSEMEFNPFQNVHVAGVQMDLRRHLIISGRNGKLLRGT